MYLTECQLNEDSNPSSSLSKFHVIADDLIGYVSYIKTKTIKKILSLFSHIERSHDVRKVFSVLLKDGKSLKDF